MTLIAKWNLDDGPGEQPTTAVDSSGHSNSHSGTYVHSTGYGLRPGGATSNRRCFAARDISRVDSILNPADLRLTGVMTVSVWAEPHGDNSVFASCGVNSELEADNYLWMVGTYASRRLWFFWEQGVGVDVIVPSDPNVRTLVFSWQNFAFVRRLFSGGPNLEVEFFVDGISVGVNDNSGAGITPPTGGSNSVPRVGTNSQLSSDEVLISQVSVWDEARSAAQILSEYNSGLALLQGIPKNYGGSYNPNVNAGWL